MIPSHSFQSDGKMKPHIIGVAYHNAIETDGYTLEKACHIAANPPVTRKIANILQLGLQLPLQVVIVGAQSPGQPIPPLEKLLAPIQDKITGVSALAGQKDLGPGKQAGHF